jgi:hypothetical protein
MPLVRPAALALADIAAGQWGMFTTAQASTVGLSRLTVARLCDGGGAERLRQGVYRLAGSPEDTTDALRAAWLAVDPRRTRLERLGHAPGAIVSHRTAALLWGLGDLDADDWEMTTPTPRRPRATDVRFHVGPLDPDGWTERAGLPVTTVLRTVDDLTRSGIDGSHLAGVVRDALDTLHATPAGLVTVLDAHARTYGLPDGEALLRSLLGQAGVGRATVTAATLGAPTATIHELIDALTARTRARSTDVAVPAPGAGDADLAGRLRELAHLLDPADATTGPRTAGDSR